MCLKANYAQTLGIEMVIMAVSEDHTLKLANDGRCADFTMLQEQKGVGMTSFTKMVRGGIIADEAREATGEAAGGAKRRKARDELRTKCTVLLLKKISMVIPFQTFCLSKRDNYTNPQ
ncbi:MAG: hypothetical protein JWP29_5641 [Rhodoferax sp.]|nr:hypothetical protein [Rhodoferax sp.]